MVDENLTITQSPFGREPNVTKLIGDARCNPDARDRLAALIFPPAFKRLDAWLAAAGLKRLNIQAEDVFDTLWAGDLTTAIDHVTFQDRAHFFRTVMLRARQAARRLARRIRLQRSRPLAGDEGSSFRVADPTAVAEHADMVGRAIDEMSRLPSPRYEIVNLYFFEGLKIRQIAEELKLPRSTVHNEMQAALRAIREKFPQ